MTELERTVSQLLSLYWMGRMSKFEASLFDLPDPPKHRARPKHARLNDVAPAGAVPIRLVHADGHVRGFRGSDQGIGLIPVHEHQGEPQALEPVAQEVGDTPSDAATIAAIRGLEFSHVVVGETEAVIKLLLWDAKSLPPPAKHSHQLVLVRDDHRLHSHAEPQNFETPHG